MFKGLERLFCELPEGEDKETLARALLMIPEHTWGLNIHTNLGDHEHYEKQDFNEFKKIAPNFKRLEASWEEQRNYLYDAVELLSEEVKQKALRILTESVRPNAMKHYECEFDAETEITLGDYKLKFTNQGEICYLEKDGKLLADNKHRLLQLVYEQFCADDYKRFYTQYNRLDEVWAREDFTKPGIEKATDCYKRFEPVSATVYPIGDKILVRYSFSKEAHRLCGCPLLFDAVICEENGKLYFDISWFSKPANRVAEAIWLGMRSIATNKKISKLGTLIDPKNVIHNGQVRLHATDFGVVYNELSIETLDAVLVAPQEPSLLNFNNTKPLDEDGIYFNLYNNVWGTNFPMWYDEDARFRFVLTVK